MLILHNVRMVPLNLRKNKRSTECDKNTIIYDIDTTQCEDDTSQKKEGGTVELS